MQISRLRAEVHLVGLDDAGVRILHRPDHARQARRRVTCRLVALLCGASLRASSIESCEPYQYAFFLWPGEQHAELVDARDDLVHEDALALLQVPVAPGELVHRDHRRIARVIGVVHGRPVHDLRALAHRVVVGDRDRFAVRDQEAVEMARRAASRCARAWPRRAASGRSPRRSRNRGACRRAGNSSRACPSRARPAAGLR